MNAWLVRRGWAVAYRRYSKDYVGQEDRAQKAKLGVWKKIRRDKEAIALARRANTHSWVAIVLAVLSAAVAIASFLSDRLLSNAGISECFGRGRQLVQGARG